MNSEQLKTGNFLISEIATLKAIRQDIADAKSLSFGQGNNRKYPVIRGNYHECSGDKCATFNHRSPQPVPEWAVNVLDVAKSVILSNLDRHIADLEKQFSEI